MAKITALIFSCFLYLSVAAQVNSFQTSYVDFKISLPEQSAIRKALAGDSLYRTLSGFEKEFIYYLNYARQYPSSFSTLAVTPYLNYYPEFKPVYGQSLLADLAKATPARIILPDAKFVRLARSHAADVASHDHMSHSSYNGMQMQQRFEKAGVYCGSECINMLSEGPALEVLLSLLVDYNVPNYGHRRSLLAEKMRYVGVGMGTSKKELQYTVIDLGCD